MYVHNSNVCCGSIEAAQGGAQRLHAKKGLPHPKMFCGFILGTYDWFTMMDAKLTL